MIHQLCMILMITSVFAMNYFVRQRLAGAIGRYSLLAVAGLVGNLVCLAYLTNVAGQQNDEDREIRYHPIDRIYSDILVGLFLLFIVLVLHLVFKLKRQDFALAGLLVTAGTLTYLLDLIFLLFYMSIMRRIKGNILWTGSLIYKIYCVLRGIFQKKGKIYLKTRKMRERLMIQEAIEAIAAGALETHLEETQFHGHERSLAEAVNHIRDGMRDAVEESVRNERLKAELITNVSHDIKTPLTSIVNYVELLKREELNNQAAGNYIRVIDEKAQRLKQLTEDLVEVSKITTGNIKLDMQPIDFVELLYQTGGEFNERFEARDLTIVTKLPHSVVMIMADGRQIYRVVENLYINAAKYALEKSRVYVELTAENGSVFFSIKNISRNPIQVPEGHYGDLTERFVRGEISRTTEGSGLGLSIAKSLTQLMGGRFFIQVEDDLFIATLTFPQM